MSNNTKNNQVDFEGTPIASIEKLENGYYKIKPNSDMKCKVFHYYSRDVSISEFETLQKARNAARKRYIEADNRVRNEANAVLCDKRFTQRDMEKAIAHAVRNGISDASEITSMITAGDWR